MKEWSIRKNPPKNYLKNLAEPALVRKLLFVRGIKTKKQAEEFLNPDYELLGNPSEILNMPRAVSRILRAIKNKEKILVFADYDADGVCAAVIFHDFFRKIGFENFKIYLPDRHQDGYGLTFEAVQRFIDDKIDLIITLDCGITDFKEIKKAKKAGIDVIVIDHHLPPEKLPPAFTIVDPHQKGEKYPFLDFCGAGLAFKTVAALIKKGNFNLGAGFEKWLLDLAALATIADMSSLLKENRILVRFGLLVLQKTKRLGLKALFRILRLEPAYLGEDDVSFLIAPRINIASRMGNADESFNLLTTDSFSEAQGLAEKLEKQTKERKAIVEGILKAIDKRLAEKESLPEVIVMGDDQWPPGVLGLTCNKAMEKYERPVFLWGKGESKERKGSVRGELRGKGEVNLVELMRAMPAEMFSNFGGHAAAAGFTLKNGVAADDFEKNILKAFKKVKKQKAEPKVFWLDGELKIDEIDGNLIAVLEKFRPFGMDNPKPVFLFSGLEVFEVREFGNEGIHLELKFQKSNGGFVRAIGFFMQNSLGRSPTGESLKKGSRIDLAASVEKSNFNGYNEIRLRIVDLKIKEV